MRKAVIRELQFLSILRTARSSVYYQQSRGAAPNVLTYDLAPGDYAYLANSAVREFFHGINSPGRVGPLRRRENIWVRFDPKVRSACLSAPTQTI